VNGRRRPWELFVLAGILLLAAWLRLRELGLVEFKSDEALAVRIARDIIGGDFRTVGLTSSVGAKNPPLFVYLAALPVAIRDDPLVATAFVAVLAVAAIALTYVVLRPRFGALVALAAAAFFATAPWAVLFGRKLWAQDMLPVFTVSLLWSLFIVLERRRSRAVLLLPVLLCVTFQLNFSALPLVVPVAAVLLYRSREVHWRAFGVGVGVAVLLLAPWLAHEARHGFGDVWTLVTEGRGENGSSTPGAGAIEAVRQTARLLGGTGWNLELGESRDAFVADAGRAWTLGRAASYLSAALLALGLVTSTVRVLSDGRLRRAWPPVELDADDERRALLLVWLGGIWLAHTTSDVGRVFPHYLIVTFPVSFAVQALGLADLTTAGRGRLRPAATIGAAAAVAAIAASYVAFTVAFHRFLDEQGGTAGDYGVIYRDQNDLARVIRLRGLEVANDEVLQFLVTGSLEPPAGAGPFVTVRNRLVPTKPLRCNGELRTSGPLEACFPSQ
jgi:4-amino-4-deoxy-L-arabinose transferase-like glycosyltransferase